MQIVLGLTTRCNLKCDFCFCHHDKQHDIPDLSKVADDTIAYIINNTPPSNHYKISILGGELFHDGIPNQTFQAYDYMLEKLTTSFQHFSPTCKCDIVCYTNAHYKKINRVINLFKKWNIECLVSYDSVGRFKSEKQKQLVLNNIKTFVDSGVKMAPTIVLLKYQDMFGFTLSPIFKYLYNITGIEYQECIPDIFNVNVDDISDFYTYCLEKELFNIYNISEVIDSYLGHVDDACKKAVVHYEGKTYLGCHYTKGESLDVLKIKAQHKFGCYTCPYYTKCGGMCWLAAQQYPKCYKKKMFDYINGHPNIIIKYHEFVNNRRNKNSLCA